MTVYRNKFLSAAINYLFDTQSRFMPGLHYDHDFIYIFDLTYKITIIENSEGLLRNMIFREISRIREMSRNLLFLNSELAHAGAQGGRIHIQNQGGALGAIDAPFG